MFWTKLCVIEEFILLAESEQEIFKRGRLSRTTISFQIELRLAYRIVRINSYDSTFHLLIFFKVFRFSILYFTKTIRFELGDSLKIQGFALICEHSFCLFELHNIMQEASGLFFLSRSPSAYFYNLNYCSTCPIVMKINIQTK